MKSETSSAGSSLLSFKEAAQQLSCSVAALRKWKLQGRLPYVMIGRLVRVRASDVEDLAAHGLPKSAGTMSRVPGESQGRRSSKNPNLPHPINMRVAGPP